MVRILDNLLSFFSKKPETSVVGIDVGTSSIKVVELKKKRDRALLQTYGEISLGPYADTEIGRATKLPTNKLIEALKDVLKEANTATPNSALSIPMYSSMVSIFKMPNLDKGKLAEMIPIEARKYIPVPISEVTLDWFVIPGNPDEDENSPKRKFIEAMVVAIHNDVLSNYSNIVSSAKLSTSFFEVEMFSTIRSTIDSSDLAPVMIIDIGASATKAYISERGVIRDSHIINKGSQSITLNVAEALSVEIDFAEQLKRNYGQNESAQDSVIKDSIDWVFDPLFADIKDIILSFQRKYKKIVSKAILVGGGSLLTGLPEKAQQKLEVEVHSGDPFSRVEAPAFLTEVLKETGASFSVAIGLALRKLQELE